MIKIDAHHHLWHYDPPKHSWISDDLKILRRDFLPDHLKPELEAAGVAGSIAVQASQSEEETQFLINLAQQNPFIKGVVGWLDLQADNLKDRLDHYTRFSLLKGLRHVVQDEPDERFLLRAAFLKGIEQLSDYGLAYDILIFPKQLDAAISFVRQFPKQKFVLDHLAKPPISKKGMSPWRERIFELAECPNVYCKISGMVTEATWNRWQPEDFIPYLEVVYKAFGPERLMFGSDWPVCLLAGSYSQVMEIAENFFVSADERKKVLGMNAIRFYDLDV